MWICTGGYRQFRGNWVKEVYGGDMSGKFECRYWGSFIHYFFTNQWFLSKTGSEGVANGTSKNVGLGKFWQDLEISEAFLISLEVSFFHGLFYFFESRKFSPKGLGLGFLTRISVSRRVSDFTIHHPYQSLKGSVTHHYPNFPWAELPKNEWRIV